jgi:hypothetical protein
MSPTSFNSFFRSVLYLTECLGLWSS